ncbi:hypothetical protein BEWA_031460 [Theileria equi strain WA]|uniref:Rieske domain-containing protein n=1 Tax=Theileria equi strain WA TaxID=1537102 RepID=L0AYF9_THEEQ|nr:hypothetical protein BEWA_031460 [Theileria equi strain WA]AFZ80293.1 hypothetical protein BEWA_031460 [Theileria equi strain WA]|eukprot:XP_004829959.1 hypothetical protein BEWA_031460 [Theileria equi strain WA]
MSLDAESRGFVDIGELKEFTGHAKRISIKNRQVAIWIHNGEVFAIDANCYHSAGALEHHTEDIEDVLGHPCIRCPQHKYIISLKTGESFYQSVKVDKDETTGARKIVPTGWKSKGIMQRTHETLVVNGRVYVKVDCFQGEIPSDKYAYLNIRR